MAQFKPQVTYITEESLRDYYSVPFHSKSQPSKYITKTYDTYAELKRELPEICESNIDDDGVFVVRSRRGQWGEWFERWNIIGNKPKIVKQGWS